jgi:aminoglycoside phosphotransferase (APT) family kinase protein
LNPGNIIVGPERCLFIDWAEAHVGHPFLTFEYFLAHLRKDYPQVAPFATEFRACYSHAWGSIASPEQIAEIYLYSPLIAVYAYAARSHVWRDSERRKVPGFQGYLRSLTRRMKREADLLQQRRVECLN